MLRELHSPYSYAYTHDQDATAPPSQKRCRAGMGCLNHFPKDVVTCFFGFLPFK